MKAREEQAANMARECLRHGNDVIILGKGFKPGIEQEAGSPSMLVGWYIEKLDGFHRVYYDMAPDPNTPYTYLIHDNTKEYKFNKNDPTLFFLQRIRDESHRFAISAHRAKRKRGISKSLLDQIEGIGSIRKRALLNHFGSARAVESASLDEIKSVEGVEEKVAKKIYNFFHE